MIYEKLKEQYPIDGIHNAMYYIQKETITCLTDRDIQFIKRVNGIQVSQYEWIYFIIKKQIIYSGYLFDSEEWHLAENTWDGWQSIDEDEFITKKQTLYTTIKDCQDDIKQLMEKEKYENLVKTRQKIEGVI